MNVILADVNA